MTLPSYEQCEHAFREDEDTPLERFIYDYEPAGLEESKEWRVKLYAAINYLIETEV
jgi:hypothetical protein